MPPQFFIVSIGSSHFARYVLPGEDALYLTEYARLHLSECTLDFSYKLVCSRTSTRDVQYMFRADTEYKKLPSYDSNTQNMEEYNKALAKALDDAETEFQEQLKRNKLVNETTSQRMCKYMDAAHWNTSIFKVELFLHRWTILVYIRITNSKYQLIQLWQLDWN